AGQGVSRNGQSPETIRDLPTGTYFLTLKRNGWPDFSGEIKVTRNATTTVERTFGQGTLALTSEPAGASVFIGGNVIGQTPLSASLPAGAYQSIEIALEGCDPVS